MSIFSSFYKALHDSISTGKIPAMEPSPADVADSMGEEGDFKMRGQPKIQGLEGIEFESGM
jgi:hypothetical protein